MRGDNIIKPEKLKEESLFAQFFYEKHDFESPAFDSKLVLRVFVNVYILKTYDGSGEPLKMATKAHISRASISGLYDANGNPAALASGA